MMDVPKSMIAQRDLSLFAATSRGSPDIRLAFVAAASGNRRKVNSGHQEIRPLLLSLWSSCDELQGGMDASQV